MTKKEDILRLILKQTFTPSLLTDLYFSFQVPFLASPFLLPPFVLFSINGRTSEFDGDFDSFFIHHTGESCNLTVARWTEKLPIVTNIFTWTPFFYRGKNSSCCVDPLKVIPFLNFQKPMEMSNRLYFVESF